MTTDNKPAVRPEGNHGEHMQLRDEVPTNPLALIQLALERGVEVEQLERLQAMAERHEGNQARIAFFDAFASFQEAVGVVEKNRTVEGRKQGDTGYAFADFSAVVSALREPLSANGFSYTFDESTDASAKTKTTTCSLHHRAGHVQTSTFTCSTEIALGMSPQQKAASASSYGKRYALLGVTGVATGEVDNDGAEEVFEAINDEELGKLTERTNALLEADRAGEFLDFLGVMTLEAITQGPMLRKAHLALDAAERHKAKAERPAS